MSPTCRPSVLARPFLPGYTTVTALSAQPSDGPSSDCPARRRVRPQQRRVGGSCRFWSGVWGVAGFHLVADPGLGRVGCNRRADWPQRHQLLAHLGFRFAWRGFRRLGVLLGRPQTRIHGRAYVAAIASSRSYPARRSLYEKVGRRRNFHRPFFWAVARVRAADRRHFRNAILAIPDCQFHFRIHLGGDVADDRRRDIEDDRVVLVTKNPPGFRPADCL